MFSTPFGYFGSLRSKVAQKLFDSLRASKVCPLKLRFIPPTFAGPRGIEPRPTVLETGILPLNYRPFDSHSQVIWSHLY